MSMMMNRSLCANYCKIDLCKNLKPPPFPPLDHPLYPVVKEYLQTESYLEYVKLCNVTVPESTGVPSTVISQPSKVTTPSVPLPTLEGTSSASAALIVVLILILIAIIIAGFLIYWWWRKRATQGSRNVNSLHLKEYENTNYLANKAQAGQCWNPASNTQMVTCNAGNQYGSFPPVNGNGKTQATIDIEVMTANMEEESQRGSSYDKSEPLCYENKNFNREEDGARSPGTNSQTPFIDEIDAILPNAVPHKGTEMDQEKSNTGDDLVDSGSVGSSSSQRVTNEGYGVDEETEKRLSESWGINLRNSEDLQDSIISENARNSAASEKNRNSKNSATSVNIRNSTTSANVRNSTTSAIKRNSTTSAIKRNSTTPANKRNSTASDIKYMDTDENISEA